MELLLALVSSINGGGGIMMPVILLILFFYALLWFISRRLLLSSEHRKKPQPPEASGALLVIGHLHLLGGSEPAHKILGAMADAHGPIFTLKLGVHKAVVVSSWEIAKECLTTNDRIFASRPKLTAAKLLGYNNSMFGFSEYGPFWRHMRKITMLGLLTNNHKKQLELIVESEIRSSIGKLYDLWVNHKKSKGEALLLVEMKSWFEDITLNTMFRMVVGKRFSTDLEGSGNQDYRKVFREFVNLFGDFVPSDSFPFLSCFDLGGYEKSMKKTAKVLDEVLDKWIKEKKNSGDHEQDFMDFLLSAVKDDEELSGYDGDSIVKANCLSLILAGSDTTATTMIWALSLLLNNEETLKKAQLELEEQVGRRRQVKVADINDLIYLEAIVKETLRLYPAAPLSVPHESTEDCNILGYYIPARTRLIVNLQKLQRDPLVWEDPNKFQPERFLTDQKDLDVKGQNPQLIPFGSGRRTCPGISFALQIMPLVLANFIHGFEIVRPSKELLDMEESVGLISVRKDPLEVVLTPRLSAQDYK
ncbi:cytochrome P450 CYP82D47-like [Benincasa hispida]|uniref:cytochrome P450 CYP82D47-like n=1 Tax=Benincasa hispida TaxID=102211 RepID=UPI001900F6A5|nr:cytochrome P450 CYP82D47-like [Benincasa hispida]